MLLGDHGIIASRTTQASLLPIEVGMDAFQALSRDTLAPRAVASNPGALVILDILETHCWQKNLQM